MTKPEGKTPGAGALPSFAGIRERVDTRYPMPIAKAFHRYRITDSADLGGRHEQLINMFELLVKFMAISQLQEAVHTIAHFVDRLPQHEKTLDFLKHPSLGDWVGLLRTLSGIDIGSAPVPIYKSISQWAGGQPTSLAEATAAARNLRTPGMTERKIQHVIDLCEILVTYRNKNPGHGAHVGRDEMARRLPLFEGIVCFLLDSADFLKTTTIFESASVSVAENGGWAIRGQELRGKAEEPLSFTSQKQLDLHELYLCAGQPGKESAIVPLGPFMLWRMNEDAKQQEVFIFNNAMRTRIEYLSYTSGTFYYHRELHEEFRELLNLRLEESGEEAAHASLSPEERSDAAEQHLKMGLTLKAQGKLEDAVAALEQSLQYERRPGTFLELARCQIALDDPPAGIRHTVQTCLESEPDNSEALNLLSQLDAALEQPAKGPMSPVEETDDTERFPTLVHSLTPGAFRSSCWLWWAGMLILYYALSAVAEYFWGEKTFLPSTIGMFVCTIVFTTGLPMARSLFLWLKLPLSLQLDTMRLTRFEKWFAEQAVTIFGKNETDSGASNIVSTIKNEPSYWIGALLWLVLIEGLIFLGTDSYKLSAPLVAKRFVDYFLVIMWLYPCVRYIVNTTAFIFRYSQLSLKPMLTKINDQGMRSLGALMAFNISLASIAYVSYFLPASFTHRAAIHSDVAVLAIITLIVSVWSIGMPMTVRRAARRAKGKAVQEYSLHIEKAFDVFLDDPNEQSRERYEWLLSNQRIIQRIGTWPLNWKQTLLLVVGSNIMLLTLTTHYILMRFELWRQFLHWIGRGQ